MSTQEKPPWAGDGSVEPPAGVDKVRCADGDVVERNEDGWWWTTIAGTAEPREKGDGWAWGSMTWSGPFEEVQP